jgi:hypothetical protein
MGTLASMKGAGAMTGTESLRGGRGGRRRGTREGA